MIGLGSFLFFKAPYSMNCRIGYHTTMSKMNKGTQNFANKFAGKFLFFDGIFTAAISSAFYLIFWTNTNFNHLMIVLIVFQIITVLAVFLPTEILIRGNFDDYGRYTGTNEDPAIIPEKPSTKKKIIEIYKQAE